MVIEQEMPFEHLGAMKANQYTNQFTRIKSNRQTHLRIVLNTLTSVLCTRVDKL